MMNPMDLTGKRILVAGISSAIGGCIASHLLELGAEVVMIDSDEEKLSTIQQQFEGKPVHSFSFSLYDHELIQSKVKELQKSFDRFDGFVFSGGTGGVRPIAFTKNKFLHNMMNANFYTFIEFVRCVTKKGRFATGGSIVAISSVSSIKGLKAKTAYSASKAALDASIKNIAAELSDRKIRVNSILKGWVSSDLELDFIKNNMELDSDNDLSRQVLGVIEPVEIANTVAFLLSDATKTMTGTNLLLDGGYTL